MNKKPDKNIALAFGSNNTPKLLKGGQGETYRAGEIVLKPAPQNKEELLWSINLLNNLNNKKFRTVKYIKARNDSWVFKGWVAYKYIEGKHRNKNIEDICNVAVDFHKAIKSILKPTFLDARKDAWAMADKMAWGELPLPLYFQPTKDILTKLQNKRKKLNLKNQIIHGDISGNILFNKKHSPTIIDFSPYWRPANFAMAVVFVDAIVWNGVNKNKIKKFQNIKHFEQLIIRALIRRICELVNLSQNGTKDYINDIQKIIKQADRIIGV